MESYDKNGANVTTEVGKASVKYSDIEYIYEDYKQFMDDLRNQMGTWGSKLTRVEKIYKSLPVDYRKDLLIPAKRSLASGISPHGEATYDWPPFLGFEKSTVTGFVPPPHNKIYRFGNLYGKNYTNKPTSYDRLAIPYGYNPVALKICGVKPIGYFEKIDAIRQGNLKKLNGLLAESVVSEKEFKNICSEYARYSKTVKDNNLNVNGWEYGLMGKVAK